MTAEELKNYKEFDTDNDGTVSDSEMKIRFLFYFKFLILSCLKNSYFHSFIPLFILILDFARRGKRNRIR